MDVDRTVRYVSAVRLLHSAARVIKELFVPTSQPKGPLAHDLRMMINRHDSYRRNGANLAERRSLIRARAQAKVEGSTSRVAHHVRFDDNLFETVVAASEDFRAAIDGSAGRPKRVKGSARRAAWVTFVAALSVLG